MANFDVSLIEVEAFAASGYALAYFDVSLMIEALESTGGAGYVT